LKKKISFEVETEVENQRILKYLENWLVDNFKEFTKPKIEDLND